LCVASRQSILFIDSAEGWWLIGNDKQQWEALIHALAQNTVKIYFSTHVLGQMARRAISMQMALETLRKGLIVRPPQVDKKTGDMKCRLEHFCAGVNVKIVVAVQNIHATSGVVVTAFK
jgi:hypothetical protein